MVTIAQIKEKRMEVQKIIHSINNSGEYNEAEREYYVGMFTALRWVLGESKGLFNYDGEKI